MAVQTDAGRRVIGARSALLLSALLLAAPGVQLARAQEAPAPPAPRLPYDDDQNFGGDLAAEGQDDQGQDAGEEIGGQDIGGQDVNADAGGGEAGDDAAPANAANQGAGGAVRRRVRINPYLAVDMTAIDDFKARGDGGGYVGLAGGVVLAITTARTEVGGQVTLQHRAPFRNGHNGGTDLTGLLRGRYAVMPDQLWLETGGVSMRSRASRQGPVSDVAVGKPQNTRMLYSIFAGPRFQRWWRGLELSGRYHLGYARTDNGNSPVAGAVQGLDSFTHALTQVADLGVGRKARGHPFGWTLTGHYEREDAGQLNQRYTGVLIQSEVVKPVAQDIALTAGAGWEHIRDTEKQPLIDAQGQPVVVDNHLLPDPDAPRRLAYDTNGMIWDVGMLWRPSKRTSGEVRLGRRYGSFSVVGSLSFQPYPGDAIDLILYDGLETYGRNVTGSLAAVPTRIADSSSPFGGSVTGCVFGEGAGGAGTCLPTAAGGSTSNGIWRGRGVRLMMRHDAGRWDYTLAVNYSHRRYYLPGGQVIASGIKRTEDIFFLQGTVDHELGPDTRLGFSGYFVWQTRAESDGKATVGAGGRTFFSHRLGQRIIGTLALDLYGSRDGANQKQAVGAALVGARYDF